jgi:hypothetical protein
MDVPTEREHYHTHLRDMLTAPKQVAKDSGETSKRGVRETGKVLEPLKYQNLEGFGHVHLTAIKKHACQ